MSDKKLYDLFEEAFAEVEKKKAEWLEAQEKLRDLSSIVLDEAGNPTEPVDVAEVIASLGRGLSVKDIEIAAPRLTEGKMRSYEGEFTEEVEKNAARIRKIVALAATVAAKGLTGI